MKIGFIGLGIMGSRMAANLQRRRHALFVHNRSRDKAEPLLAHGAHWCDTPATLAREVDVVVTMLSTPAVVEEAAFGADGFEQGVALPVTGVAKEVYALAVQNGLGTLDYAAIYQFLGRRG